jgi:hypothetical protein
MQLILCRLHLYPSCTTMMVYLCFRFSIEGLPPLQTWWRFSSPIFLHYGVCFASTISLLADLSFKIDFAYEGPSSSIPFADINDDPETYYDTALFDMPCMLNTPDDLDDADIILLTKFFTKLTQDNTPFHFRGTRNSPQLEKEDVISGEDDELGMHETPVKISAGHKVLQISAIPNLHSPPGPVVNSNGTTTIAVPPTNLAPTSGPVVDSTVGVPRVSPGPVDSTIDISSVPTPVVPRKRGGRPKSVTTPKNVNLNSGKSTAENEDNSVAQNNDENRRPVRKRKAANIGNLPGLVSNPKRPAKKARRR